LIIHPSTNPMFGHHTHAFTVQLLSVDDEVIEKAGFTLHAPTLAAALDNVSLLLASPMAPEARAALIQCTELDLSAAPEWSAPLEGLRIQRP
jgi:hypothetical protein